MQKMSHLEHQNLIRGGGRFSFEAYYLTLMLNVLLNIWNPSFYHYVYSWLKSQDLFRLEIFVVCQNILIERHMEHDTSGSEAEGRAKRELSLPPYFRAYPRERKGKRRRREESESE